MSTGKRPQIEKKKYQFVHFEVRVELGSIYVNYFSLYEIRVRVIHIYKSICQKMFLTGVELKVAISKFRVAVFKWTDVFENLNGSPITKKKYVKRFLKQFFFKYYTHNETIPKTKTNNLKVGQFVIMYI